MKSSEVFNLLGLGKKCGYKIFHPSIWRL